MHLVLKGIKLLCCAISLGIFNKYTLLEKDYLITNHDNVRISVLKVDSSVPIKYTYFCFNFEIGFKILKNSYYGQTQIYPSKKEMHHLRGLSVKFEDTVNTEAKTSNNMKLFLFILLRTI